ncbi:MAG: sugar phosphate isomerase/epimerase family protein [Planctomycetota bacterium]|jgi:sugar phosphate isomerase/epimerase
MSQSRIAVCSWSMQPRTPDELVRRLLALEIPAVQLALNPVVQEPATWGDAPERLRDAGIEVVSGMMAMAGEDYSTLESIARTGGLRPDETWPTNLGLATRVAECAAQHDIHLVTFHAGFIPEESRSDERHVMMDRLHLIADAFRQRRVRLGLETGQETATTLHDLLQHLDRGVIGVNFDPANMILYGRGDPVDALRTLSYWVCQIHVKDARPTQATGTWGTEVPVGEGAVDWPAFFEVASTIDPPVDYVIEREAGLDREGDIAVARDLVARLLNTRTGSAT